mgnify:CR=1 FL=1
MRERGEGTERGEWLAVMMVVMVMVMAMAEVEDQPIVVIAAASASCHIQKAEIRSTMNGELHAWFLHS